MEPFGDYSEISREFMELTSENRDYVLAIARALSFAQKTNSILPPDDQYEQQKDA